MIGSKAALQIGVLQFEVMVDGSRSLKDKRRVIRSLKDRLRRKYNVSIAEVGSLDKWNIADLALVAVSRDGAHLGAVLNRVTEELHGLRDGRLGELSRQVLGEGAVDAEEGDEALWTEAERRDEPAPRGECA